MSAWAISFKIKACFFFPQNFQRISMTYVNLDTRYLAQVMTV